MDIVQNFRITLPDGDVTPIEASDDEKDNAEDGQKNDQREIVQPKADQTGQKPLYLGTLRGVEQAEPEPAQ